MKVHALLFALLCSVYAVAAQDAPKKTVKELLAEATVHLAGGKVNDAMQAFDLAIELEPTNYLALFRRAAAQLSVGRMSQALKDFDSVLKLRPKFDQALIQRGKLYLKDCQLKEALQDLRRYSETNPKDTDVLEVIGEAEVAEADIQVVNGLINSKDFEPALETLNRLVQTCPLKVEWRLKRAEIYLETNDLTMAAGDFSRIASIKPTPEVLHRLAGLRLQMGELTESLNSVKECMKHDPENKPCKKIFKTLKTLDKTVKKVETMFTKSKWLSTVTELFVEKGLMQQAEEIGSDAVKLKAYSMACKSYAELGNKDSEMEKWCSKTIDLDENHFEALYFRGEWKIKKEDFEGAMRDLKKAHEANQQDRRIVEAYQKAERLLAQSKKKDYYKVLGVARTASKKDIKKAFRKLAQQWHPDKYKGDLSEEDVRKKMSEINEAYEVLEDDEKRSQFDNGIDPNEQQQGGGHHHGGNPFFFQQGGFQGGGFPGGQQFHFNF
ncbi:hypothetical protein HDU99_008912 [Rhizoclosmatium hyalinum]|nr:hypothetical protein HDU99_008912 [Rhizoclosmatium hyalinum]